MNIVGGILMTRLCSSCKQTKPLVEFTRNKKGKDGYYHYCLKCNCEKSKRSRHSKSPEDYEIYRTSERARNAKVRSTRKGLHMLSMSSVKTSYNITKADLQNLLNKQKGLCVICKADFGTELRGPKKSDIRQYDIDHCHETGKVRGLLCPICNKILGFVEQSKVMPDDRFKSYLDRCSH